MLKSRHRRTFALAVTVCITAFTGLVATPASAHAPVGNEMFNPDEFNGDGACGLALATPETAVGCETDPGNPHVPADNDDGNDTGETKEAEIAADTPHEVGSTYPLRSVSFTDAVLYEWWDCDDTAGDEFTTGQCSLIATDTTPNPSTAPFLAPVVNAWSGEFNIPAAEEGSNRHIRGVACASDYSAGTANPSAASHCTHDTTDSSDAGIGVEDMHFDDSSSTADHGERTTGGRIWAIDYGFAAAPGPDLDGDDVHGAVVPNDESFTIVGFTSDPDGAGTGTTDVDAVHFCLDEDSDPLTPNDSAPVDGGGTGCDSDTVDTDPDTASGVCSSLGAPFNLSDCWEATFSGGDIPDGDQFAVSMIEYDDALGGGADISGSGDCEGDTRSDDGDDCQLDKIYLTSQAVAIEQTHAHNDEACCGPDTSPTFVNQASRNKGGDVFTGLTDEVIGAFFNQFADNDGNGDKDEGEDITSPATWEITSTTSDAAFSDCQNGGTGVDPDANGNFAACNYDAGDTNSAGETGQTDGYFATLLATVEGTVTLTFCADPGFDGCADAATHEKDTLTKNVVPGFDHTHLRFSEDVPGPAPECHTGAVSKSKPAASNVSLTGCVQDAFHQGAEGVPVIWRILAGPPTQFVSVEQVSDGNGRADAVVTAPASSEGQVTTVRFCTDFNTNGTCDSEPGDLSGDVNDVEPELQADIQVTWTKATVVDPDGKNEACEKAKQRVKRIKKKLRRAIANDASDEKIKRLRNRLRRAKLRRARLCP
jgi:hypothetical protein